MEDGCSRNCAEGLSDCSEACRDIFSAKSSSDPGENSFWINCHLEAKSPDYTGLIGYGSQSVRVLISLCSEDSVSGKQ